LTITSELHTFIQETFELERTKLYYFNKLNLMPMKIQVHAVHFSADQKLLAFIQEKLSKLDRFYNKILSSEVFLRLDKGEKHHTHTKMLEIKINLPGAVLFVKEMGQSFEEAIDLAIDVLKNKIKKFKDKTYYSSQHGNNKLSVLGEVNENEDLEDDF
jgi:putative sigma-54 modulation protein